MVVSVVIDLVGECSPFGTLQTKAGIAVCTAVFGAAWKCSQFVASVRRVVVVGHVDVVVFWCGEYVVSVSVTSLEPYWGTANRSCGKQTVGGGGRRRSRRRK